VPVDRIFAGFVAIVVAVGCSDGVEVAAASHSPFGGEVRDIGGLLPHGFEPSGAAWQPRTHRLIVVSDDGRIAEIDAEGGALRVWPLAGDLEDVCIADAASDRVYVAVESPPSIVEFDLVAGGAVRTITLPADGANATPKRGLEALAFVPDAADPDGGVFWAGFQSDGSIRVFSIPLRTRPDAPIAREVRRFTPRPGHRDLSGLAWDQNARRVLALYDTDDRMVTLDGAGRVGELWFVPGDRQEGIAVAPGWLFLADDDAGRVMRYERRP